MSHFAHRCGIHDGARQDALAQTAQLIAASGVELVRFVWCDLHGVTRGKTLVAAAAAQAMRDGVRAGRAAHLAGRIPRKLYATASSPEVGVLGRS